MTILRYFWVSILFTAIAMGTGYYFGGMAGLFAVIMLGLLETSLSVDNAVVNAKQLAKMDAYWRKMFLTVGMIIAVFGMRVVFPVLIVGFTTGMDSFPSIIVFTQNLFGAGLPYPDNVTFMAFNDPEKYARTLTDAHAMIAGFGGAFLMMVFLKFFIDTEKEHHWLAIIEKPLARLGKIESVQIVITMVVLFVVGYNLSPTDGHDFFIAGIIGIIAYILVGSLEVILGDDDVGEDDNAGVEVVVTITVAKNGLAGFLYLEILDASFSFDGVIGAFAVTNNLLIIALGLGIGAMFVRSMTLLLVDKGTLSEFRFLEHSAFYAIGALATIMFIGTFHHLSELVSGTIGAVFILCGLGHSILENRREVLPQA